MTSQWNMSPAKPADLQIPSSTRERTDCTSSLATPADLDEVSLLSRLVSLHRSERDADSKVKKIGWTVASGWSKSYRSFQRWRMHMERYWGIGLTALPTVVGFMKEDTAHT